MTTAKPKPSVRYGTYMQHLAWSVVCLFLLLGLLGMWVQAQTLQKRADDLQQQLLAAKRPAPSTCKVRGDWRPDTTTRLTVNGRSVLVHVPQGFVPYAYYPMAMIYPGKAATAEAAQAAYGLDALPAITVYPYPTTGKDGILAWQGAPYSSDSDDVGFTAAIIDKLQDDLCVDRTKIYAIGMSNGGGFVSLLSCKLPERFAAYAVIAGAMYAPGGQCKPSGPSPLISVHGDSDPIVPYDGSALRQLPPIDSWTTARAAANGCAAPVTATTGINTVVTTWTDCTDNATVQNVRIRGGGHAWGEVTNESLWRFLSGFSL